MAYYSSAGVEADTLTLPSHQAGDLIVLVAYVHNAASLPTIPSGWNVRASTAGGTQAIVVAWKIAASGAETSGTWTGATSLTCWVGRDANYLVLGQCSILTNITTTTVTYLGISSTVLSGASGSIVLGIAGIRTNNTDIETAPTGMINRITNPGASDGEVVIHDTNGLVTSYSNTTVTINNAPTNGRSFVVEIINTGYPVQVGGGSSLPLIGTGGLVY